MSDNDLDTEGLVDAVRGQRPSQAELPFKVEEVLPLPTPDEIVSAEPQMSITASGLLSSLNSDDHSQYLVSGMVYSTAQSNDIDLQIHNNAGQSVAIRPDGTIRIRDSHSSHTEYVIDLRDIHQRQQTLEQRIDVLEQTIELLGRALQAQVDEDTMTRAGLSRSEIDELRRVVRARDHNQLMRRHNYF